MRLVAAALLMASVGCHGSASSEAGRSPSAQTASGSEAKSERLAESDQAACCSRCPLALPGVKLAYAESSAGGSLVFRAPDSELEELRLRVRELAAFHNKDRAKLAMMTMPHNAEAIAIDGGAQLKLTTPISNDVQAFQHEIENEVQWMQGGRCPGSGDTQECVCQLGRTPPLSSAPESSTTLPPE